MCQCFFRAAQVDDEFMFGDSYVVAPILAAGLVSRNVYLPAGNWTHVFSGVNYTGGRNYSVPAPLDSFPLFARDLATADIVLSSHQLL